LLAKQHLNIGFVIDDQDYGAHLVAPFFARSCGARPNRTS
jgi:hypothetical protein